MIEIKGKVNTAICYAKTVEDEAIEQIRRMCDYSLTEGSKIRIMPDVHAGKGCTIGTTMTISGKACPNIVGVDIGCGMYTVKLADRKIDFQRVDEAAHYIPSGMNVWDGRQERFELENLRCYRQLKDTRRLERSLGTLGGGNHFIEIEVSNDGTYYLIIHSGSRNLGKQVAEIYQQLAVDLHMGKEEFFRQREELIKTYKEEGRRSEIQKALKALQDGFETQALAVPKDICWLYGSFLEDYLHDVEICQDFARRNREHGAGRIMSRAKAKESLLLEDFEASMEGIYTTSVSEKTLDEAPMAYKSIDDIIDVIRDSVDIIDIMKPVYNFKASDEAPWKKKNENIR